MIEAEPVEGPSHGTLILYLSGWFDYRPEPDFHGVDSFKYRAFDGSDYSDPMLVLLAVNGIPSAQPDFYITPQDTPLFVDAPGLVSNDGDPDGDAVAWARQTSWPSHGTIDGFYNDGSFRYTPNPGFVGTDSFSYQAGDGTDHSEPVTVTITVGSVTRNPVPVSDDTADPSVP